MPAIPHIVLAEGESYTTSIRRLNEFNYTGLNRKVSPGGHLAAFHPAPRDSNGYAVRVGTELCVPGIPPPRDLDELEARLQESMPHTRLVRVNDAAQHENLTPRLRSALGRVNRTVDAFFQVKPTAQSAGSPHRAAASAPTGPTGSPGRTTGGSRLPTAAPMSPSSIQLGQPRAATSNPSLSALCQSVAGGAPVSRDAT